MKKLMIIGLVLTATSLKAQSLKDALYGGKLRLDTGTVIRKGDDLSTKIDTSTRKPVAVGVSRSAGTSNPLMADDSNMKGDSLGTSVAGQTTGIDQGDEINGKATASTATGARDNNEIWKEYIDTLTSTLRSEVMPNKKVKNGDYSILIDYVIGIDGTITVNNVSSYPESSFLDQQVRERLTLTSPTLTPLLNSYGKPRKAPKKQTINLSK